MIMKKLLLLLLMLTGLSACHKYDDFPLRPVSFEIWGKKYYSAKDTHTVYGNIFNIPDPDTLRVCESDGRLSISYSRNTDFLNHDIHSISLGLKGVEATFETGNRISFDLSDNLENYPYVYLTPIKTSYASDSDLYSAVKGWIEFDEIDWDSRTLSGRFAFDAELEEDNKECSHDKKIEVKNGSFMNIPFSFTVTPDSDSL